MYSKWSEKKIHFDPCQTNAQCHKLALNASYLYKWLQTAEKVFWNQVNETIVVSIEQKVTNK